jgi:hypothetical protein
MLQPIPIYDGRATRYATVADFCQIFSEEMHSLYLLAYMLTADHDQAEQCFVRGLDDCKDGMGVFLDWANSWARHTILKHAIRMTLPAPDHTDQICWGGFRREAAFEGNDQIAAVLALNTFDRFVFVISVLERESDEDCSALLKCTRQDLMIARQRAIICLADADQGRDRSGQGLHGWLTLLPSAE